MNTDIFNNKIEIGDIIVYPNFSRLALAIYLGETDGGYIKMSYGDYKDIEKHDSITYRKYSEIIKLDRPKADLDAFYERCKYYKEKRKKN